MGCRVTATTRTGRRAYVKPVTPLDKLVAWRQYAFRWRARPNPHGTVLERLGSDYGGWIVDSRHLGQESVCYLAGVGEDTTFDFALINKFGCTVHAFDPTPRAVTYADHVGTDDPRFRFHPVGLLDENTHVDFYEPADPAHASYSVGNLQATAKSVLCPVRRLTTLMGNLGHDRVDLLKLDIEGAEYSVIEDFVTSGVVPRQLCVEFHQVQGRSPIATVARLKGIGYRVVAVERWNVTLLAG